MGRSWMAAAAVAWVLGFATCTGARAGDWADAQAAFYEYDDQRGLALLERAALAGDARAQLAWGLALRHGAKLFAGLDADPIAAKIWLDRAAAAGDAHGAPGVERIHVVHAADVPAAKRTRLGLYLRAVDALALTQAKPSPVLFLDIRTRAEATYVGMPDAADLLVPYMEHEEFMHEWDAAGRTFKPTIDAGFADAVARAVAQRGLARDDAIVVLMCRSGLRSAKAADLLAELGYRRVVSVIDGFEGDAGPDGRRGVNGWKNAGLPWSYRLDQAKVARRTP